MRPASRTLHGSGTPHRPALSAAATACQGRRREGSVPWSSLPRPAGLRRQSPEDDEELDDEPVDEEAAFESDFELEPLPESEELDELESDEDPSPLDPFEPPPLRLP